MPRNVINLSRLSRAQLKSTMRNRLHGLSAGGPLVDRRLGPEPYEWLLQEYKSGKDRLRDWMEGILREFLEELPDPAKWDEEARANLFVLLQLCGANLSEDVQRLVRTRRLLDPESGGGPDLHAGLLKCLMALGHKENPRFWMTEFKMLGHDYGALIFAGLAEHGVEEATKNLLKLCRSQTAAGLIRSFVPNLIDRFGKERVVNAFKTALQDKPPKHCAMFRDWLDTVADPQSYEKHEKVLSSNGGRPQKDTSWRLSGKRHGGIPAIVPGSGGIQ